MLIASPLGLVAIVLPVLLGFKEGQVCCWFIGC